MLTKLGKAGVLLLTTLTALVLSGPAGASAAPHSKPFTQPSGARVSSSGTAIHTFYSGKCLDADLNTINDNGAVVQLWDCNYEDQQLWYLTGDFAIHVAYNGRCLDADVNHIFDNGDRVQLWECNGSPQQKWYVYGDYTIRSAYSGLCLDADINHIWDNGDRIQLWECTSGPGPGPNQKWYS
jgi:Ricin-type beta-trefoil lectin domain